MQIPNSAATLITSNAIVLAISEIPDSGIIVLDNLSINDSHHFEKFSSTLSLLLGELCVTRFFSK